MGPTRRAEILPSADRSLDSHEHKTQTGEYDSGKEFCIDHQDKEVSSPLESTHLNGSFQAIWPETFDLPTIHEDQFEDFGEASSPSFKRSSPTRGLGSWRSTCDLSGLDGDGSCCSSCSESSEKLSFLEDRLSEMENDSWKAEETARRQRNVSKRLIKRVNSLEEHLQVEKLASDEALRKMRSLHDVALQKVERVRELQVEDLNTSVRSMQEEKSHMRQKISALSTQNRALEKKVHSLEDELSELQESLQRLQEHALALEETVSGDRRAREAEREAMSQVIVDLQSKLPARCGEEDATGGPVRRPELEDNMERSPAQEKATLELDPDESRGETEHVAQENIRLRVEIEELQEALLCQSGEPRLPTPGSDFCSLVDEMELSNREQTRALHEQKEINRRLRQYLDHVILTILEKAPALLEVKPTA